MRNRRGGRVGSTVVATSSYLLYFCFLRRTKEKKAPRFQGIFRKKVVGKLPALTFTPLKKFFLLFREIRGRLGQVLGFAGGGVF